MVEQRSPKPQVVSSRLSAPAIFFLPPDARPRRNLAKHRPGSNWKREMSIFAKIRIFIEDTMEEMRKCSWPSREQLLESTLLVLVTMVAVSLFVFGIDQLLSWLITFLISF